jgi:hypothetical protein
MGFAGGGYTGAFRGIPSLLGVASGFTHTIVIAGGSGSFVARDAAGDAVTLTCSGGVCSGAATQAAPVRSGRNGAWQ